MQGAFSRWKRAAGFQLNLAIGGDAPVQIAVVFRSKRTDGMRPPDNRAGPPQMDIVLSEKCPEHILFAAH